MIYLDSSALIKVVSAAPETGALLSFLARHPERVTSALTRVEILRAVRRASRSDRVLERARSVLDRVAMVAIDDLVLATAGEVDPRDLEPGAAIHLATALSLPGLVALVTYDSELERAARRGGLTVEAPAP
jgi:predicted nucleic acid-binding protein